MTTGRKIRQVGFRSMKTLPSFAPPEKSTAGSHPPQKSHRNNLRPRRFRGKRHPKENKPKNTELNPLAVAQTGRRWIHATREPPRRESAAVKPPRERLFAQRSRSGTAGGAT